jgi:hypothetical protein
VWEFFQKAWDISNRSRFPTLADIKSALGKSIEQFLIISSDPRLPNLKRKAIAVKSIVDLARKKKNAKGKEEEEDNGISLFACF